MAVLSTFYPQPVVSNAIEVTSSDSTTARNLSNRFSDAVNVKDFGATGDGVTDDWLAIARAIYASVYPQNYNYAGNGLPLPSVVTLSDTRTVSVGGGTIPNVPYLLYTGQPQRTVFFPAGFYRITRPIPVGHGSQLVGLGAPDKCRIQLDSNATYNGIENMALGLIREYAPTANASTKTALQDLGVNTYNANLHIENLSIRTSKSHSITRSGTTATATANNHTWQVGDRIYVSGSDIHNSQMATITAITQNTFSWTVSNSGPLSSQAWIANTTRPFDVPLAYYPAYLASWPMVTTQASSGTSSVIVNRWLSIVNGTKIKFSGGSEVYTVASYSVGGGGSNTTLTLTTPLSRTVNTTEFLLIGIPANNGIFIHGGENSSVDYCYMDYHKGAGIYIWNGSPSPTVNNCMSNHNMVGYWQDGANVLNLYKPSGDGNSVFLRSGFYGGFYQINCFGLKHEDFGGFESDCIFELATDQSGSISAINVLSGGLNAGVLTYANSSKIREMVRVYSRISKPNLNIIGLFAGSYGSFTLREYNRESGALINSRARLMPSDNDNFVTTGNQAMFEGVSYEVWPDQAFNLRLRGSPDSSNKVSNVGILSEHLWNISYSVPFTRTGTSVEFTLADHKLQVGDHVILYNAQNVTPWFSYDQSGISVGNPSYYQGTSMVQSVSATTFTITVNDSGPSSGTAHVGMMGLTLMHVLRNGCHKIQMPNNTVIDDAMMFQLIGKKRQQFAGLLVNGNTPDDAHWWVKNQLRLGNTAQSPSVSIQSGSGIPSVSAPNGSLFLRTDGTADTTLYVRAGGTWTALTSS